VGSSGVESGFCVLATIFTLSVLKLVRQLKTQPLSGIPTFRLYKINHLLLDWVERLATILTMPEE